MNTKVHFVCTDQSYVIRNDEFERQSNFEFVHSFQFIFGAKNFWSITSIFPVFLLHDIFNFKDSVLMG